MEKRLGERLQEVKLELEEILIKVKDEEYNEICVDKIRVLNLLEMLITNAQNDKIKNVAMDAHLQIAQIDPMMNSRRFFNKFVKKDFIELLEKNIRVINEEIPKENRLDYLEEKLLKSEITFPNCDYESEQQIQEMIRNNARAIARIIVTSK